MNKNGESFGKVSDALTGRKKKAFRRAIFCGLVVAPIIVNSLTFGFHGGAVSPDMEQGKKTVGVSSVPVTPDAGNKLKDFSTQEPFISVEALRARRDFSSQSSMWNVSRGGISLGFRELPASFNNKEIMNQNDEQVTAVVEKKQEAVEVHEPPAPEIKREAPWTNREIISFIIYDLEGGREARYGVSNIHKHVNVNNLEEVYSFYEGYICAVEDHFQNNIGYKIPDNMKLIATDTLVQYGTDRGLSMIDSFVCGLCDPYAFTEERRGCYRTDRNRRLYLNGWLNRMDKIEAAIPQSCGFDSREDMEKYYKSTASSVKVVTTQTQNQPAP